jgi:SAM-dependent methyltransferase
VRRATRPTDPSPATPPRARAFGLAHLAALDDEALREFLAPGEVGVDARVLGIASQGVNPDVVERFAAALPDDAGGDFRAGQGAAAERSAVAAAEREVVGRLFWPLLYWHDPAAYEELVAGEHVHADILAAVGVGGNVVCDIGSGAGRFTLFAAATARSVVAIDAVPAMLERLSRRLRENRVDNVEVRRGGFSRLPVADRSVDVAVSCSSLTSRSPFGGAAAVAEMERIVRPGGRLAVIWPDRPEWFVERGFRWVRAEGNPTLSFPDAATAERVCGDFYSPAAARWVAANRTAEVPYSVLGVRPPNDVCLRELPV